MRKRYHRHAHHVSWLHAHLVFCTKYRRKVITARVFSVLRHSMTRTAAALGLDLSEIEAEGDHLHILLRYPPTLSLSTIVQRLKGASSYLLRRQRFPEVLKRLWGPHFWSAGWFVVSCGGAPLDTICQYIQHQRPFADASTPYPDAYARSAPAPSSHSNPIVHPKPARFPDHGLNSVVFGKL